MARKKAKQEDGKGTEVQEAPVPKRPTKKHTEWHPSMVERARLCAAHDMTDYEIATALDIDTKTLWNWRRMHPELAKEIALGKDGPNRRVERSLYHRAIGYSFNSEKIQILADGTVVRVPFVEHVPPEVRACEMWLKNREPDRWRDRVEQDTKVEITVRKFDWQSDLPGPKPVSKANGNGANGHGALLEHKKG